MNLNGRTIDSWGNVTFTESGLYELLMTGGDITGLAAEASPEVMQYNQLCKAFDHPEDQLSQYVQPDVSVEQWDQQNQNQWFTPEPFSSLDMLPWLLERCETPAQRDRVNEEWPLFVERDMIPVLRFLVYLVDHLRSNRIVWGVGRGSSVSSYVLYLIGVHRIDSMRYGLEIGDFLK